VRRCLIDWRRRPRYDVCVENELLVCGIFICGMVERWGEEIYFLARLILA
jgi:hypothetical protein